MPSPSAKRQKTHPTYELLYHPGIPGRGEYVRLALEAAGAAYTDVANEEGKAGSARVYGLMRGSPTADADGNPPIFAPPALRVPGAGKGGKALVIAQTPNILLYLGERLGLMGEEGEGEGEGDGQAGFGGVEGSKYWVNQLVLTALDLCNEAHDTHHPVAAGKYYEEQKEEALKKATDFRENRVPKFLGYFERTLKGNEEVGKGKYLVGGKLTVADTTLWQSLDGIIFGFPNEMNARRSEFPLLFDTFYPGIKEEENIKAYLSSKRRLAYSNGIWRHYPELDREA